MSESEQRTTFWMVWREDSPSTHCRHWSEADALGEAERLARQAPGETFFVLEATAALIVELPPIKRLAMSRDTMPF